MWCKLSENISKCKTYVEENENDSDCNLLQKSSFHRRVGYTALYHFLTTVGALNNTQECSNVSAFVDFCFLHLQSVNFRVTALNLHSDDVSNVCEKVNLFPGLCRLLERFLGKAEEGESLCCCL